jgi:predicted RNA-binding protein YlqC (UPF0109 family)
MTKLRDLLQYIVQAMVDNPDQVEIFEMEGSQSTILELKVAKTDLGKVIGKKGRNAQAIRDILHGACGKTKKRITLEIIE